MGLKARNSFLAHAHVMAEVWQLAVYDYCNFLYQGFQDFLRAHKTENITHTHIFFRDGDVGAYLCSKI